MGKNNRRKREADKIRKRKAREIRKRNFESNTTSEIQCSNSQEDKDDSDINTSVLDQPLFKLRSTSGTLCSNSQEDKDDSDINTSVLDQPLFKLRSTSETLCSNSQEDKDDSDINTSVLDQPLFKLRSTSETLCSNSQEDKDDSDINTSVLDQPLFKLRSTSETLCSNSQEDKDDSDINTCVLDQLLFKPGSTSEIQCSNSQEDKYDSDINTSVLYQLLFKPGSTSEIQYSNSQEDDKYDNDINIAMLNRPPFTPGCKSGNEISDNRDDENDSDINVSVTKLHHDDGNINNSVHQRPTNSNINCSNSQNDQYDSDINITLNNRLLLSASEDANVHFTTVAQSKEYMLGHDKKYERLSKSGHTLSSPSTKLAHASLNTGKKTYSERKRLACRMKYQNNEKYREQKKQAFREKYQDREYREKLKGKRALQYQKDLAIKTAKKEATNIKYTTNQLHRENIKSSVKKKYAEDSDYKEAVKAASKKQYSVKRKHTLKASLKKKYAENEKHRQALKASSKTKYAENEEHRQALKASSKAKYAENEEHRQALKASSKKKYAENEEHRQALKAASKKMYAENEEHRQALKASSKTKYAENEEHRQALKASNKKKYAENEEHRQALKAASKKMYTENEEHRQALKAASKKKYVENEEHRQGLKASSKNKYAENEEHRQALKASSKIKYAENEEHRKVLKASSINKYAENEEHRQALKATSKKKYAENEEHRQALKAASKKKYAENEEHRQALKAASKKKYAENEEHRQALKASSKSKYAEYEEHRQALKASSKTKYAENEEHRQALKATSKKKYAENEEHRDALKTASKRKYVEIPELREMVKIASKRRYSTDTHFRDCLLKNKKIKYNTDEHYRHSIKQRNRFKYRNDCPLKEHVLSKQRLRYNTDKVLRHKKILSVKENQASSTDADGVILSFRKEILKKPKYVCCVCHKFLWREQCIPCHPEEYAKKASDLGEMAEYCITNAYVHSCSETCEEFCEIASSYRGKYWICFTCHRKLLKGEMPPESQRNGLQLTQIPDELKDLNDLERHLLALRLPFMKLVSLPKGGQKGVIGPCVSVPTDFEKTTNTLPRCDDDAHLIRVKLKRKLPYKGHYKYQFVNTKRLKLAFNYLRQNNPWYSDVKLDPAWENPVENIECDESINPEEDSGDSSDDNSEIGNITERNLSETSETHKMQGVPVDTCLQPDDIGQEVLDQYFEDIFCVAPAENNTPVSMLQEVGNEAMSFPSLFPDGKGSYNDDRPVKITPLRYFHNRLLNADSRFASNNTYIFYAQYLSELQQVISGVSIALRKGTSSDRHGQKITANMITDKTSLKNILKTDQGYKFLKPVRGTPPYWQTTMKDLFAMIRQKGIPTWFCSFSAADMRWPEIVNTILEQQGSSYTADDLDWSQKCEVLSTNSVMNALMFNHRFHSFLKKVILSDVMPIGKIENRFHRVEFQKRGSPHTHCTFWVKDSPKLDKDDDDTICSFIDRYVTCHLPDEKDDPELNEIVSSVQRHSSSHSKSCKKKGTNCRFNFPRPPSEYTFISRPVAVTDSSSEKSPEQELMEAKEILQAVWDIILDPDLHPSDITTSGLFQQAGITQEQFEHATNVITKRVSIVLKRSPADIWINQYNSTLLKSWNANMDIQFILDAYSCVMYIISYISKAERELGLILEETRKEAVEGNLDAEQAMKKLGTCYFHQREVCVQEAVYRVCGLHLKECSCMVQFVPVGDNQIKMSKPLKIIKGKSDLADSEDIWMSSLSDKYKARPASSEFQSLCYTSFCSEFRILSPSQIPKKVSSTVYELQDNLGYIQKRTRTQAAVIRYPRFSAEKNPESYYQSILQLFLPHRSEEQLKPKPFKTYEEFYKSGTVKLTPTAKLTCVSSIVDANQALFEKDAQVLDDAQELMEKCGPLEDAWASLAAETEKTRHECEMEIENSASLEDGAQEDDVPELSVKKKQKGEVEIVRSIFKRHHILPLMRSLNGKQKEVFYFVRQWCIEKVNGKEPDPFRLFITGGAGTGKSHLVKCLFYEVQRLLSPSTPRPDDTVALLTAPTGTAAFNIGGTTIHSAFSISTSVTLPYKALKDDTINSLRSKLQYLQVLFIDEISMVDQKLLIYVSERLRQIKVMKSSNVPFGNICVIAVGDFYQLPPVRQATLLKKNPKYPVNFFTDYFHMVELEEIMRQKDDAEFANMLNRFRVRKKKDPLNQTDIDRLEQCQQNYQQTEALHVFATNNEVNAHNYHMARKVCDVAMNIRAQDFKKDLTTGKLLQIDADCNCSNNSLPSDLFIGKGARVMLIRNLDISDGLVNGVFGTVERIFPPNNESSFWQGILVKFDNEDVGLKLRKPCHRDNTVSDSVLIKPITEDLGTHNKVRHQFPLQLAWACTVHKVQGTTTDAITTSFSKIFSPGQAYVALSRCTSLKGLMIKDLDISKIYCDEKVDSALAKMQHFKGYLKRNVSANSISLIVHNIQGLYPHFQDLTSNTDIYDFHYICLTETWLKPTDTTAPLSDYTFQHKSRFSSYDVSTQLFQELKQQSHGGVGMFARTNCAFCYVDLGLLNIEYMAFQIHKYKVTVVLIYRPESYPVTDLLKNLDKLIQQLKVRNMKAILLGDFNENLLKANNPILRFFTECGYKQLVTDPTTDAGTLIDHVYSNTNLQIDVSIIPTYYSYHNMIALSITSNCGEYEINEICNTETV